jgi:hypothetical protein
VHEHFPEAVGSLLAPSINSGKKLRPEGWAGIPRGIRMKAAANLTYRRNIAIKPVALDQCSDGRPIDNSITRSGSPSLVSVLKPADGPYRVKDNGRTWDGRA